MQTKKKVSSKTSAREAVSPRRLKSQKKQPEHAGAAESKDANMITSSAQKPKSAGVLAKQNGDAAADLNIQKRLLQDVTDDVASGPGSNAADIDASFTHKEHAEGTAHSESESIFSPNFHLSRSIGDSANGDMDGACLSSEVSTIYLTMKTSKLECLDECGQDSMSTDSCVDEEEQCEEFDDFDPYLFIKNLPELSKVVPTYRPLLLPKQTRRCPPTTLVLDLDETLVHSSLEPCEGSDFTFSVNFNQKEHTVYVRCRPHLQDFMERVAGRFEIIIFTASQSIYAEQLLNVLDPKRKVFRHRVYRESCVFVEGNYLKDLSILGRDLARVIIIDNSPQAFGFQVDNGIPIESWFEDRSDQELLLLLPFLDSLVGVEDVRPLIAQRYNLRQRIDAAAFPSSYPNKEDPFERS